MIQTERRTRTVIKQFGFLIVAFVVFAAPANAQQVFVADTATLNLGAGEAQSTVVAPGKKTQCQQGRFLVTTRGARNDRKQRDKLPRRSASSNKKA